MADTPIWKERFPIGDGNRVDEDNTVPVYRSYKDCGIPIMTRAEFDEITGVKKYNVYLETETLKPLQFTPLTVPIQPLSDYYFLRLDFKIPRPIRP